MPGAGHSTLFALLAIGRCQGFSQADRLLRAPNIARRWEGRRFRAEMMGIDADMAILRRSAVKDYREWTMKRRSVFDTYRELLPRCPRSGAEVSPMIFVSAAKIEEARWPASYTTRRLRRAAAFDKLTLTRLNE